MVEEIEEESEREEIVLFSSEEDADESGFVFGNERTIYGRFSKGSRYYGL